MNTKKYFVKVVGVLLSVVVFLSAFAGCSGKSNTTPEQTNDAKTTSGSTQALPPLPLKVYLLFDGVEFPKPGNEVEQIIEKATNTDLEIKGFASSNYTEMLSTLIASGDLPDILALGPADHQKAFMINAFRGDLFWEVGPYIKDYKNLASVNPIIYDNIKVDGKIYGFPKVRPLVRRTFIYRKDWFDKLGLKEPKTLDEFYEVAKALTFNDPDGNGKKDTYGLVMEKSVIQHFTFLAGAPNVWENRNGQFIRDATTPEYLDGLKYIKKLYTEGIIHPDFAILDRNKHIYGMYNEGKAAIVRDSTQQISTLGNSVVKNFPNAQTWAFSLISGPKGLRTIGETGHNGITCISKARYKKEEDLKRILDFYEKLGGQDMSNLFTYGVEGKHYKLDNGVAVPIEEKLADFDNEVKVPYRYTIAPVYPDDFAIKGKFSPLKQLERTLDLEAIKYMTPNPVLGFISPTATEKSNLEQIISDASIKFIMGQLDENGFKKEIQRWRDSGGDKIAQEYADEYKKNAK